MLVDRKLLLAGLLSVLWCACGGAGSTMNPGTSAAYQRDMDIVRLQDLQRIGGLLDEYHERTGTCPFVTDDTVETYVFIATPEQREYVGDGPSYEHRTIGVDELRAELERVLDREIKLPADPQKVPVNKPSFYLYMTRGQTYNLAVHVHRRFSFARNVKPDYNKVEISNRANPELKIWTYDGLMKDEAFQSASSESLRRPGFIEQLGEARHAGVAP